MEDWVRGADEMIPLVRKAGHDFVIEALASRALDEGERKGREGRWMRRSGFSEKESCLKFLIKLVECGTKMIYRR